MSKACHRKGKLVPALIAELTAQVESWHPCPHIPGCIVVNVGDSLQAWSDGILKSNYHRVRMPKPGEPTVICSSLLLTVACMVPAPSFHVALLPWSTSFCMCTCPPCIAHSHSLNLSAPALYE